MTIFTLYRLTRTFDHITKLYYYDNQNKTTCIHTVYTFLFVIVIYLYTDKEFNKKSNKAGL